MGRALENDFSYFCLFQIHIVDLMKVTVACNPFFKQISNMNFKTPYCIVHISGREIWVRDEIRAYIICEMESQLSTVSSSDKPRTSLKFLNTPKYISNFNEDFTHLQNVIILLLLLKHNKLPFISSLPLLYKSEASSKKRKVFNF